MGILDNFLNNNLNLLKNEQNRFWMKRTTKFREILTKILKEKLNFNVEIHNFPILWGKNIITSITDDTKVLLMAHYDTPGSFIACYFLLPIWKIIGMSNNFLVILLVIPVVLLYALIVSFLLIKCFPTLDLKCICIITPFLIIAPAFIIPNLRNFNDNTSGILTILSIAEKLKNKDKVALIFTDQEEFFRSGSKNLKSNLIKCLGQTKMEDLIIMNFDPVGTGEYLLIHGNKKGEDFYNKIKEHMQKDDFKNIIVTPYSYGTSDHISFPNNQSVCFSFLNKALYTKHFYPPRVHTFFDNVGLDKKSKEEYLGNIEKLSSAVAKYIEEQIK